MEMNLTLYNEAVGDQLEPSESGVPCDNLLNTIAICQIITKDNVTE